MATKASTTIAKAFQVLQLFRHRSVLTSSVCAESLGIPRATAHRLLVSLREVGAVEISDHGQYRLGLALFELGSLAPQQRQLANRAIAVIEQLADTVGFRVHIGVRQDLDVLYVHTANGRYEQRMPSRVGHRGPLHATALGKALLSDVPPSVLERLCDYGLRRYTPNTIASEEQLLAELQRVRETGVAYSCEEHALGTCAIAIPVRAANRSVTAAISLAGRVTAMRPRLEWLTQQLQDAVRRIEAGTAWQPTVNMGVRDDPRPAHASAHGRSIREAAHAHERS